MVDGILSVGKIAVKFAIASVSLLVVVFAFGFLYNFFYNFFNLFGYIGVSCGAIAFSSGVISGLLFVPPLVLMIKLLFTE